MTKILETHSKIAIFPGSFDPYTIGHYSIVERALPLFDKIIIAVGYNETKHCMFSPEQRKEQISKLYSNCDKIEVITYQGLTIEVAEKHQAKYILRGIRTTQDFEYEKTLADINRSLSGIETILLYTLPEHSHISSSAVRELLHHNRDVSSFLPNGMKLY